MSTDGSFERVRSRYRRQSVVDTSDLPRSFYWLFLASIFVALALPFPPVKYALLLVFGFIFVSFYKTAPERTLFTVILGIPALELVPQDLIPLAGVNAETIVILSLVGASIVSKSRQENPARGNPFVLPVAFYVLVLAVSALLSYSQGKAMRLDDFGWEPIGFIELFSTLKNQVFFVLLGPISFTLLRSKAHIRTAIRLVAGVTMLVSLHALWLMRDDIAAGVLGGRHRAAGLTALQPNLFGGYLALMIAMLIPLLLDSTLRRRERLLYLAAVASALVALVFTFSRGAWLAALVTLIFIAATRGAKAMILILLIGVSATWWLPEQAVERAQSTFQTENSIDGTVEIEKSARTRVDQWKALPRIWLDAPVLGHGFKSFQKLWAEEGPRGVAKSAHSSIVEIVAEEGLLGLIAYAWLIWALVRGALYVWRREEDSWLAALALGLVAAVLCLLLLDLSGTRFRSRGVMAYVWIIAGGLARYAWILRSARARDSSVPPTAPRAVVS